VVDRDRGFGSFAHALHRPVEGARCRFRPDSFDNALAETTNGLYKTDCVYGPDAAGWEDIDHLELATLGWVH
jgi:hypothetical protein